jgi:DNA-binding CsgD family transcriptional regulator
MKKLDFSFDRKLTKRELDVFLCILDGKTNQQIADEYFLSIKTIKFNVTNIYKKLKVQNRKELKAKFLDKGPVINLGETDNDAILTAGQPLNL